MSGAHCELFPNCMAISDTPKPPKCDVLSCPGARTWPSLSFFASDEHYDDDECPSCGGEGFISNCFDGFCADAEVGCDDCTVICPECKNR